MAQTAIEMKDPSGYLSYDLWKSMVDAVEDADSGELAAILTPFLIELGPFAPVVAGALSFGGKELILSILKSLPHMSPSERGDHVAGIPDDNAANATNVTNAAMLKIGRAVDMQQVIKHTDDQIQSYNEFIVPSRLKPVIAGDFRRRIIEQPVVSAEIYPQSETYFLHPRRNFVDTQGPSATYAKVGF